MDSTLRVRLIDFEMATKFLDEDGDHFSNKKVSKFNGNLAFATVNTLNLNSPSRKDDLL